MSSPLNRNNRPRTVNDVNPIKSPESPSKVNKNLNLSSGLSNLYNSADKKDVGLFDFLPKEISNLLTKNRLSPVENIFKNPNLIINPAEKVEGSGPNSPNAAWSRKPSLVTFAAPSASELLTTEVGKEVPNVDEIAPNSESSKLLILSKETPSILAEPIAPIIPNTDSSLDNTLKSPILNLNSIDMYAKNPIQIVKNHPEKFEPDSSELHIGIPKSALKNEASKKVSSSESLVKQSKTKSKVLNVFFRYN